MLFIYYRSFKIIRIKYEKRQIERKGKTTENIQYYFQMISSIQKWIFGISKKTQSYSCLSSPISRRHWQKIPIFILPILIEIFQSWIFESSLEINTKERDQMSYSLKPITWKKMSKFKFVIDQSPTTTKKRIEHI